MKNFSEELFFDYEVGRSLNKEFINNIYELFKKLNESEFYNEYYLKIISTIKLSDGTQIITYTLYKSNELKINLTFKLKNGRYLVTFKNKNNDEIISISAPKFNQISDMIELYLPDFFMLH